MKELYRDNRNVGERGGRRRPLALAIGLLAVFLVVFAAVLGYAYRRQLADAWRQQKVASIPPPPGVQAPVAPASPTAPPDDDSFTEILPPGDDLPLAEPSAAAEGEADDTAGESENVAAGSDGTGAGDADQREDSASEAGETDEANEAVEGTDESLSNGTQPPPGPAGLPKEANLNVPMVYQAPFNVWDAKHDDACEEASALMVASYWFGELSLSRQEMENRLMDLIDYQMDTLGYFKDTNVQETADFMKDKLGLSRVAVLPVNSLDDIRRQIAAGRPVILPADGKALQNPNFRNGGPDYHMFVAKGYTATHLIVNDPGTRRGANWLYANEIIEQAVHDFNGGDVRNGQPLMIVAW